MSSRALRKALREREAQLQEDSDHIGSEDEQPAMPQKKSAFAMLGEVEEDKGDDEEEEEETVSGQVDSRQPAAEAVVPKSKAKKKKAKKKNYAKADAAGVEQAKTGSHGKDNLDEIDQALKQLSVGGDATQPASTKGGADVAVDETCRLLAIDTNHLHAQNEMRRLFGRAALEQQDDEEPQQANAGGNRRQQRRQQAGLAQALRGQPGPGGRAGLSSIALRRNLFIQGNEEWPAGGSGGLGMEIDEKRTDGTIIYKFVHSKSYQDVQLQFESCVESMDPNRLVVLLQHNPYHISTLLQVSEIAKHERDPATSGDLLERALFSFGRAVHSTFGKTLAAGKARLDFARPENREFWLASWRYMQNLAMRATWRTVYEWAKLLLSLSPDEDPYAMWMVLDQYALRSRQELDYLNLSRNITLRTKHEGMPNIELSQGLAEVRSGNKSKGQQALFRAIGRYPWVVARIMQENNLGPPPAIWGREPRTDREKLYSEHYATTAKDLWNTPEASSLLVEVSSALMVETPTASLADGEISSNEARHVLLAENPPLIALIPRSYTEALTSTSDPLPPLRNLESYSTAPPGIGGHGTRHMPTARAVPTAAGAEGVLSMLTRLFRNPGGEAANDEERDQIRRAAEEQMGMSGDELLRSFQEMTEQLREHEESGQAPPVSDAQIAHHARLRELDEHVGRDTTDMGLDETAQDAGHDHPIHGEETE